MLCVRLRWEGSFVTKDKAWEVRRSQGKWRLFDLLGKGVLGLVWTSNLYAGPSSIYQRACSHMTTTLHGVFGETIHINLITCMHACIATFMYMYALSRTCIVMLHLRWTNRMPRKVLPARHGLRGVWLGGARKRLLQCISLYIYIFIYSFLIFCNN